MAKFTRLVLDSDGDLLLRVGFERAGEEALEVQVCSATMRRASPVWKAMLFGPWKESKPAEGDWVADLPEDDPWPILVILRIIHGAFDEVPEDLSLSELSRILVYTDKYDMVHVLRPMARRWVYAVNHPESSERGRIWFPYQLVSRAEHLTGQEHVLRLHAAWELGCEAVVAAEVTDLVFNLSVVGEDVTFGPESQKLSFGSHLGLSDLIDHVMELRGSLIQTLLDFYHEEVQSRMDRSTGCRNPKLDDPERDAALCTAAILGGIWQYLTDANTPFLPEKAEQYSRSANDLMCTLANMFCGLPLLDGHDICSPGVRYPAFQEETKKDERWMRPLLPHHLVRLADRRKKTGL